MREIVNGIFYVMRAGCPWRLLPNDLPPWGTIYRWFAAWRDDGCFERINHALVMADRERVGRDASPTAAIIDSQSAKTTEAGGPRGYDAGKKINGRKRHALVDTDGRGLVLEPHPASIQDRDGGGPLLRISRRIFPFIQRVFADSGYAGEKVTTATLIAVEIVRKNPDQVGFAVNPRRWVVERFFAWIGRNRRLAKDFRHHRLRTRLPLRRIRHAARASDRSCFMTFETNSKVHPCHIVGLPSERNLDFARGTGGYDRIVTYDNREILNSGSVAVADFSGNSALIRKLQDARGIGLCPFV